MTDPTDTGLHRIATEVAKRLPGSSPVSPGAILKKAAAWLGTLGALVAVVWGAFAIHAENKKEHEAARAHEENALAAFDKLGAILEKQQALEAKRAAREEAERDGCIAGRIDPKWCYMNDYPTPRE